MYLNRLEKAKKEKFWGNYFNAKTFLFLEIGFLFLLEKLNWRFSFVWKEKFYFLQMDFGYVNFLFQEFSYR